MMNDSEDRTGLSEDSGARTSFVPMPPEPSIYSSLSTEARLAGAALALGARSIRGWSDAEDAVARHASPVPVDVLHALLQDIQGGGDPLGSRLCVLRSPRDRRPMGATYTPNSIVAPMIRWAAAATPVRVVDPGTGSGRYLVAAGRAFSSAALLGIEVDPLAALLARATLAAAGFADRSEIVVADYRSFALDRVSGRTLFIGNPPYVRHHLLGEEWKTWFALTCRALGLRRASKLAGLHAHFFVRTAQLATPGDRGVFVTASEWLDVNYGQVIRDLLLTRLGGRAVHLIDAATMPFADATTTAAITCFEVANSSPTFFFRHISKIDDLADLNGGCAVNRDRLLGSSRWTGFTRPTRRTPEGYVELGELCRVHRGAVTGANSLWIWDGFSELPEDVLFPAITRARELFAADGVLAQSSHLRQIIDLPADLGSITAGRAQVERFLQKARLLGGDKSYIARNRRPWWRVGLRAPAPILATYMARRTPAFVRNLVGARHINIAHGIYPRDPMPDTMLDELARHLTRCATLADGRVYAGGLTKFEPKEMERLLVPMPVALQSATRPPPRVRSENRRDSSRQLRLI